MSSSPNRQSWDKVTTEERGTEGGKETENVREEGLPGDA